MCRPARPENSDTGVQKYFMRQQSVNSRLHSLKIQTLYHKRPSSDTKAKNLYLASQKFRLWSLEVIFQTTSRKIKINCLKILSQV